MSTTIECPETRQEFINLIKKNSNKIIIVKAHANWCRPCKQIAPFVKQLFDKLPSNKLLVNLNIDDVDDVSAYLKIKSIPLLIGYINGEKQHIYNGGGKDVLISFFKKCGLKNSLSFDTGF